MKKNITARGSSSVLEQNADHNSYKLPITLMRNDEDETQSCGNHVQHKVINIVATTIKGTFMAITPMLMVAIPLDQLHHVYDFLQLNVSTSKTLFDLATTLHQAILRPCSMLNFSHMGGSLTLEAIHVKTNQLAPYMYPYLDHLLCWNLAIGFALLHNKVYMWKQTTSIETIHTISITSQTLFMLQVSYIRVIH